MLPVILAFLISSVIFSSVSAAEISAVDIEVSVSPREPLSFQPFTEDNAPAEVRIIVTDRATGEPIKNAGISFTIDHKRGRDILNTGFPYLEGKRVLGGSFISPDGELQFSYIFPVRGNYIIKATAFPTELSPQFAPTEEVFRVHVREHSYEVRNAVILGAFLLLFGVFIGMIYGRARLAKGER